MAGVTDPIDFTDERVDHAVEVAPRIWWVGAVLPDDPFQCHAYLVEAGEHSVLVDAGSTLTIRDTLRKVAEVVPLDAIETLLVHHSDPDVCDGLHHVASVLERPGVRLVTEWRSALLMRHLALPFPFETVEDLDWTIPLDGDRRLRFALTPYLHFPGAFVTFDETSRSLLSSDLFGGFNRARRLWATSADDFEDMRQFHEHYMPSREVLIAGLATIVDRFSPIERVLPQHGYLIPEALVGGMIEQLGRLECGVMLASRSDTHLQRLLAVASAVRRIGELLDHRLPIDQLLRQVEDQLEGLLPLASLHVEAIRGEERPVRFDRHDPQGVEVARLTVGDDLHHVVPIPDADGLTVAVVLTTTEPFSVLPELGMLVSLIAGRVQHLVQEALGQRDAAIRESRLRSAAHTDPLTGMLNRRALDEWTVLPDRAAVLMLDIDHFKAINDRHGHVVGDAVLQAVARRILTCLRRSDRAVRFGGEEFLLVAELDAGDPMTVAIELGERVRAAVERMDVSILNLEGPVTVSVGVDLLDRTDPLLVHVQRADAALYLAKQQGRNAVRSTRDLP